MSARLEFDEATHTYTIDGQRVPSVTDICKPLTIDIAENAKPWLRDAAARKGTAMHEICADIDICGNSVIEGIPPEYWGYIQAYLNFKRDYQIKDWIGVELQLGSAFMGVAGTVDRVGVIDGKFTIVDIKTGSKIDKALLTAQLNGYLEIMACSDCNVHIKQLRHGLYLNLWGLQLMKDSKYTIHECKENNELWEELCWLYRERERINGK